MATPAGDWPESHRQMSVPSEAMQANLRLSGKRVVRGGCERPQRVPALAPGITDALLRVQDDEGETPPHQVVACGQPGLAATNNDGLDTFPILLGNIAHHRYLPA